MGSVYSLFVRVSELEHSGVLGLYILTIELWSFNKDTSNIERSPPESSQCQNSDEQESVNGEETF